VNTQVFVKVKKYTHIDHECLKIKDVANILTEDEHLTNRINSITIYKFDKGTKKRIVLSALYIIRHIQSINTNIDIVPIGETDIVIKYEPNPANNKLFNFFKILFVCLTSCAGAAFSIIAFNSDVDLYRIFSTLHDKLNITDTTYYAILEISYSIGIPAGIIVFYNHFGKKKLSVDPTPLEIEMRLYENDINTTIIDGDNREVQ